MSENTCRVSVHDGGRMMSSHTCGRKLSGSDDYPDLCGLHASAKRRAKAAAQAKREAKARRNDELAAADARVIALNNQLEIVAVAQTTMPTTGVDAFHSIATGNAIVPIDQLEKLAAELDQLRTELARWHRIDGQESL